MSQRPVSIYPSLKQNLNPTSSGSTICSYSHDNRDDGPIVVLIHGYPQSAFMWRYLIPILQSSLFIPELPGYGVSTLPSPGQHSKQAVGGAILEALTSVFDIQSTKDKPREIILVGHDRGARIAHRLAVGDSGFPHLEITGLVVIDIVPTKVQWEVFSNPMSGAAYFHWPFLANVDQATKMIGVYGGDNWCRDIILRAQGSSPEGLASFAADKSHDIYAANFSRRDAIFGSCQDYHYGSVLEVNEQSEDMKNGLKINVPTLVIFSEEKLGKMHDVANVWKDWIAEGVKYQAEGIGSERGHYLPEEAPKQFGELVLQWLETGNIE